MTERQCKAPVRYDFQVVLEDDDDTVTLLMDSFVYLKIESDPSRVGQETGDKLPQTCQNFPHASSSRVSQETSPKSPHTSEILPDVISSSKETMQCCISQTIPNPKDSGVQKGLNVQRTIGGYKLKQQHGETSQNDISCKVVASPPGLGSRNETIKHCADAYQLKRDDDDGTPQKSPSAVLSFDAIGVADAPYTRDSKTNSFHTSGPYVDIHKLKVDNINEIHTNASKAALSEGAHSKNSVVVSSVVNAKRKLPDDQTVICISDDECVSDSDVVCIEPCKYSKPLYICQPENSSHTKTVPKAQSYMNGDISIIKDIKPTCRPRKAMKSEVGYISNDQSDIIIEKIIYNRFGNDIVTVIPPSKSSIDRFGRKGSRRLLVN